MNNFKRILDLVRLTGDKLVVTDPEGERACVVMDLDDYELLLADTGMLEPFSPEEFMDELAHDEGWIDDFPDNDLVEPPLEDIEANFSPESPEEPSDEPDEQFYLEPVE